MAVRFLSSLCFVLLFNLLTLNAHGHGLLCADIFDESYAPTSINYYLSQVAKDAKKAPTPQFLNPKQEIELSAQWVGTRQAPRAIREALLNNTALINIPLLAADTGTVKMAQPGNFTSLRLNHEWNGKDMSTNIGLPIDALFTRALNRTQKLVPENTKAVFIFMHGGGTKTTGHHVAAALSNFMAQFGVVILSIDAPFHAYGPRVQELSPLEYYQDLRDFRHQFIPENVPTFIGGHSMGGIHADNIMRISDRPELGMQKAFKGLINLSGPLDSAPGKSIREKGEAEELITKNEELMKLVPEAERDLSVLLLTQGKSSALGGVSAQIMLSMMNWVFPSHRGNDYIPTLVVMGARDALYIGREAIFEKFQTELTNTDVHIMDKRLNFKGQEQWISHMIFDHYRPGTKDFETFNLIKEFMEKQLGETFVSGSHQLLAGFNGSTIGLVTKVMQEYFNNLTFRKFADQYTHLVKHGTDKMVEMGKRTAEISREMKMISQNIKALEKEKADVNLINAEKAKIDELQAEMAVLRSQQRSEYVPEGPLKEMAQANVARREQVKNEIDSNIQAKRTLLAELKKLRDEETKFESQLERAIDEAINGDLIQTSEVVAAKANYEKALNEMIDLQTRMNELNSDMVYENIDKGIYEVNPPASSIEVYKQLDEAYANYNRTENLYKHAVESAIAKGELGDLHRQTFINLYGKGLTSLQTGKAEDGSIVARIEKIQSQIETIELHISSLNFETNQLLATYIREVTPDLFTVEFTSFSRELDRRLVDIIGNTSKVEQIWKVWADLWKERPPEQGTSLY